MTPETVPISHYAVINPRIPTVLKKDLDLPVSFVPMSSVSEEGYIETEESRKIGEVIKGYTYFERGDILLAKITPCLENGKAALADTLKHKVGFGTTEFHVLRPKKETYPRYLFHQVWNPRFRFYAESAMKGAAGQKRVPVDIFDRYMVPELNYKEQKRIATILDKADAILRKRQKVIQLADEFLRSVFLDMFGDPVINPKSWPKKPLGESLVEARNGLSRRAKTGDSKKDIVLRLQDIRVEGIRIEDPSRITLDSSETERYQMMPGDIAFIRVNGNKEYVGRSAVFSGYSEPVYFNDHIIRLRFEQDFQPQFLSRIFNSKAGKQLISKQLKTSAGQYTISQSGIESIVMFKPPRELQNKFIQLESAVHGSMRNMLKHTDIIQAMFSSLQKHAFRGDL